MGPHELQQVRIMQSLMTRQLGVERAIGIQPGVLLDRWEPVLNLLRARSDTLLVLLYHFQIWTPHQRLHGIDLTMLERPMFCLSPTTHVAQRLLFP